jgi:hypothetical protein
MPGDFGLRTFMRESSLLNAPRLFVRLSCFAQLQKPAAFRRRAERRYIRGATPLGSFLNSDTDMVDVQLAAFGSLNEGKNVKRFARPAWTSRQTRKSTAPTRITFDGNVNIAATKSQRNLVRFSFPDPHR